MQKSPHPAMRHQISRGRRAIGPIAPFLFLLPLSLDFKSGERGGLIWQYAIVATTFVGWSLFWIDNRLPSCRGRLWQLMHSAILLTLGGSLVSFGINGTPVDQYARVILQLALFGMAFYFGAAVTRNGETSSMYRLIEKGCAVSAVFSVGAGLIVTGQEISEVRYQILSPVLLLFEAILCHKIFIVRNDVQRSILWLIGCLALQVVSVTRSALIAAAIILATGLWITSPTISGFFKRGLRLFAPGMIAVGIALLASTAVSPEIANRWHDRIFTNEKFGVDPTTVSRLAEIKDQMQRWSSGPISILIGNGYGAPYGWSKDLYDVLLDTRAFQLERIEEERFEFGHNFWVSSLFCGGLLFGLALPMCLIYATYRGLRISRLLMRLRIEGFAYSQISRSTLVLTATLAMTIGGNPFGYRYGSLIAGVALGSMVAAHRALHDRRLKNGALLATG